MNWFLSRLLHRFFSPLLIANAAISGVTVTETVVSEPVQQVISAEAARPMDLDDILSFVEASKENKTDAFFTAEMFEDIIGAAYFDPEADSAVAAKIKADSLTGFRSYYVASEVFLSKEEAKADIEFLFAFMQNSYPGYHVFGGKEVFDPVKERLLAQVDELDAPITPDEINILLKSGIYNIVRDRHFVIDGTTPAKISFSHWVEALDFLQDDKGFYMLGNSGGRVYISSCYLADAHLQEEKTLADWMIPAFNDEGDIVYKIGGEFPVWDDTVYIEFSDGFTLSVPLAMVGKTEEQTPQPPESLWDLAWIDTVPVLAIRSFSPWGEEQELHMEALVDTANLLKQEPYLILDLRGNIGGNADYAYRWLVDFTYDEAGGKDYAAHLSSIGYLATLSSETTLSTYNDYWGDYEEWLDIFYNDLKKSESLPNWVVHKPEVVPETIPNNTVVFVLMDRDTVSAPEYFIAYLNKLENVVLVGESTGGMFHFGGNRNLFLPNSGSGIFCSVNLFMLADGQMIESAGFVPDIFWDTARPVEEIAGWIQVQDAARK